jgi:aconitate hydratase
MDDVENSFDARAQLEVGDRSYEIFRLDALEEQHRVSRLPYSLKVLLENLLRNEDGVTVTADDVTGLAAWDPDAEPDREIAFAPARILMQDFTGVPAVVDLAAMRDAMVAIGGDATKINPLVPVDLVIDHSIVADVAGVPDAFRRNDELEFQRNRERYEFLRWGQGAFENFRVVPPNTGICHQVNLEYLSQVVFDDGKGRAYPDTLVGTDSHTPMVNGLGVLGWGVGGIEAEAAMLGQAISMLVPRVVGVRLSGEMPEGATATDLVLVITELLRQHGVVGKFVEFYGPGVAAVPLANRATIGNMTPEYGATATMFPIDEETLRYLEFTGRPAENLALVEAYAKAQGMWRDADTPDPVFSERLELDLSTIVPSLAGPKRPQDRVRLDEAKERYRGALASVLPAGAGGSVPPSTKTDTDKAVADTFPASDPPASMAGVTSEGNGEEPRPAEKEDDRVASNPVEVTMDDGSSFTLDHGKVVIAAITSCTNTSNPSVMLAAGLLAKRAVEKGLDIKPWVKATLAPGSKVVMDYYEKAGLIPYLDKLRFNLVGFGCTSCIGNSGPLAPEISKAINDNDLAAVSVLSGNRNFEGRINPDVRMNYLASPPLVVAYALAGTMDIDLYSEPLGTDLDGQPVFLKDLWPSDAEVSEVLADALRSDMFRKSYSDVFKGDLEWNALETPEGDRYDWQDDSTYVRLPSFFTDLPPSPGPVGDITGARVLAKLGDSVTTDHISPAGVIRADGPAGEWLREHGVPQAEFNSYGSRRGNHEVMIRGTFANIRLRNQLAPGTEGGYTTHVPSGDVTSIYEAAERYAADRTPLVILAGKEYGSGSSRDWAAKGTALLGVRAVIAESYERIHRSNLIGMGVLPLQLAEGDTIEGLGLTGHEEISITGIDALNDEIPRELTVRADDTEFTVRLRIDTPNEAEYYRQGGILHHVLRQLRDS